MQPLKWSKELSVGVKEIDDQHKREIELINQLIAAAKDHKKAGPILHQLAEHTVMHFKTEEKYFKKFGFEQAAIHKKTHDCFLDQAGHLVQEFDNGKDLDEDHLSFVAHWLVNHIIYMDKKYTKCFNGHGLT
ncbi:TPA: hemerythrin family protein [Candidatus Woesearchaeota archaeon]|nr:hemerythrin family protein [Candidatus Woesearchaeota archaeon]